MKKVSNRASALLVLSALILFGLVLFAVSEGKDGARWVTFPSNQHLYNNGALSEGRILDRTGSVLWDAGGGDPSYAKEKIIRKATLHAVGDASGNIATAAKVAFADKLTGYNLLNGVFSLRSGGNDLYLTLDAEVCKTALEALNGHSGAVGVYNYKTGEMLCMVSSPTFDPQHPPEITADNAASGLYLNRFLSSSYTPGSVFKLVTAAAAIDCIPDIFDHTFTCSGSVEIGDGTVTCPSAHGTETFETALAESCNTVFAQVAAELGPDVLQRYAQKAGFGSGVSVNGIDTAVGLFDVTGSSTLDLAWAGIGQYTDLANPCAFLTYVGAIANGGVPVQPRLIAKVTGSGELPFGWYFAHKGSRVLSAKTAQKLSDMMRSDVTESYGANQFPGLELCAKSGTAQVGGDRSPNAWFVGFLRNEEAPLAFVVVVEEGGSGLGTAAPIANKVLQAAVKALAEQ